MSDCPPTLLERRPDVAEAERQVASANAQIGVARAAYFPKLTLNAAGGVESTKTSNLLSTSSVFWSLGPQISAPIFEGGRLVAETARVKAVYEEQAADYRNTVLTAYQDVEDNLIALRRLQEESETDAAAVLATGVALKQAQDRYGAGIVTYLEVSTAETAALQAAGAGHHHSGAAHEREHLIDQGPRRRLGSGVARQTVVVTAAHSCAA